MFLGAKAKKKGKKKNKKPCGETPVPADHIVPFHEPASQFVEYDGASSDGSSVIIESEGIMPLLILLLSSFSPSVDILVTARMQHEVYVKLLYLMLS